MRIQFIAATVVATLGIYPIVAAAQDAYPTKPITIINPNAPGGIVDIVARALATFLQKPLKQPVIVVNRPGAGSAIGNAVVANAAPDGYTVLLASPALAALPAIDELFGTQPLFKLEQLIPIAQITSDPTVIVAHPMIGTKNAAEFIARAKAKPNDIVISSSGTYGATHLPMVMLEMATGSKFRHVATSGGGPAMTMTLGGHSQAVASAPGIAYPQVQSGKLVAIAQTGGRRFAPFNDLPTLKESGIDVEYYIWTGLFAPAKTPAAVLKTFTDAVRQVVQDPEFRAAIGKSNANLAYLDGAEYQAVFEREA
ncbi:MAG: tripartite tricarboxylate transporter substrate binding protein, partial [Burkholderiales bacterium]